MLLPRQELNLQYMVDVELALAATFSGDELSSERQSVMHAAVEHLNNKSRPNWNPAVHSFDGHPPPHFYGELVRTEEGCKYLRAAGHLEDFAAIVSLHEDSDLDADYVVMLKAVLWALVSPLVTPTEDMTKH